MDYLKELCSRTLNYTDFKNQGTLYRGKVRDNYFKFNSFYRTMITTDRISCFDKVVGTIPLKGQVLNQLSAFWFKHSLIADIKNHFIGSPDPNVSIVKNCYILPVEFVCRGYLTGSTSTAIWTAYEQGNRVYCGHKLPNGLKKHEQLKEPIVTPTTKAISGNHDQLVSKDEIIRQNIMPEELYTAAEFLALELFNLGSKWAKECGLILADTKYEFGVDNLNACLIVVDELHTPDSSRYWYKDQYEQSLSNGLNPPAIDKEYVRLWLKSQGYTGEGTPPELPVAVRCEAARRYIEAYEQLTQKKFEPNLEEPKARIEKVLSKELCI